MTSWLIWLLPASALAVATATMWLTLRNWQEVGVEPSIGVFAPLPSALIIGVGTLVAARARNVIGWLLAIVGGLLLFILFTEAYAFYGLLSVPRELPGLLEGKEIARGEKDGKRGEKKASLRRETRGGASRPRGVSRGARRVASGGSGSSPGSPHGRLLRDRGGEWGINNKSRRTIYQQRTGWDSNPRNPEGSYALQAYQLNHSYTCPELLSGYREAS